ncbi:MAG: helix-turn-helix transcriptional regulator [Microbacteriaceae bacterium]
MTTIDPRAIQAWYRRLAGIGARPDPEAAGADARPSPLRFSGEAGLRSYAAHTRAESASAGDPHRFECATLERRLGALTLSGHLVTPSSLTHEGDERPEEEASITFAISTLGVSRWATPSREGVLLPGRMLAVPSVHPVRSEALELTEQTSLHVPLRALGVFGGELFTMPTLVLPETPLTRAVGMYLTRLLFELACEPPLDTPTSAALEAATLELITAVTAQLQHHDEGFEARRRKVRAAAERLIERDYSSPQCTVESIAHALHVSRRQLYRYFSDEEDGIAGLISRRRLEAAYELLTREPQLTVAEVAERCGYGDAGTLRSRFRRAYNLSPTQLREVHFAAALDNAPQH